YLLKDSTMKNYDVCIIGAGIIGLSIAWQLARRSTLKILVLEKGAGVGEGSTGASSAVCRFRYSLDEMVNLARDGIYAYRDWQSFTGLAEPRARFQEEGVLWMPGSDKAWADKEHVRMQRFGIPTEVLDNAAMKERFPSLNTCTLVPDLDTGEDHICEGDSRNFFEVEGGYMDPVSAAQDLVDACREQGVDILFKSRVIDIATRGGQVESVSLGNGDTISTPLVINASGPWCQQLFKAVGLNVPWDLSVVRIQVLYRDLPEELQGDLPVTIDMEGGIYFRTQNRGQQLIVSSVLEEDERESVADPDNFSLVHDEEFEHLKLHLLHHRLPGLPYRGKIRGYCGLYTVNRDDVHPILGPTEIEGFWVANGFSGHGFKLAPAIGSMIAQSICNEKRDFDTSVPLSFFAIDRRPIDIKAKSVLA
ncbi:MAG: sarcosine oxidase subunit beta, partial [Planctomycetota bacterium]